MESNHAPRRLLRLVGRLAVCASIACAAVSALADSLDERNELIHHFVTDFHANPLVADCAAHGNFIASTSAAFDHVEFPPAVFDPSRSTIEPWNDSFDEKKQRIKVDNVVTVEGEGVSKSGESDVTPLKFRCGYVGSQMLAFGWNDPVPPLRPRAEPSSARGTKGKHGAKTKGASAGKSKSSGKSTKKSAKKH
ncbi:hypothetical protein P9250_26965 [Caballeronia sp. LP006]|uniref:BspC domain-containing protein n=1 Tax=unclassified Caballeronia TaxID=2646786 RepID=UPI002028D68B|nr:MULTISPECIES: hypothetical protein [unclassified Caballeronia]MDR5771866.1 hypothetical protein [Caballeronia sp. LZ002]MDR5804654.1 hypothetical protein [Caballeronia sp. LZ001]MDR5831509.1 hypothetical protein [Caballeronia sp. LP006]MDR5847301.1 hypothetical protein [Caballeronia sp. LZ003]